MQNAFVWSHHVAPPLPWVRLFVFTSDSYIEMLTPKRAIFGGSEND